MEYRNVSLERKVAGKRRHYSTYYSGRARRLVEEIYARDLDLLGYEFEDETRTSVLVPLYEMDQLRQQREEVEKGPEGNPLRDMGFRFQVFRCHFLTKRTIKRILRKFLPDVIRKNIRKNFVLNRICRILS